MFKKKKELNNGNNSKTLTKTSRQITSLKESANVIIGNEVKFKGTIYGANEITIEGSVNAKMNTNNLIISETGQLKGKIVANIINVWGVLKGNIKALDTLIINEQANVFGNIEYNNLEIKLGGQISGEIKILEKYNNN